MNRPSIQPSGVRGGVAQAAGRHQRSGGHRVAKLAHGRRLPLCERRRFGNDFGMLTARVQKIEQYALVVALARGRLLIDRRAVAQLPLGLVQVAAVTMRQREQSRVMGVVPVVVARDVFASVVLVLEPMCPLEDRDRLGHPPDLHQIVPAQVQCVRHLRRRVGVCLAMLERLVEVPEVLVAVNEVVVRAEVSGRQRERALVERNGRRGAALTAAVGAAGFFRVAALRPELRVHRVAFERVVQCLDIGKCASSRFSCGASMASSCFARTAIQRASRGVTAVSVCAFASASRASAGSSRPE